MYFTLSFPFYFGDLPEMEDADGCWAGQPSPFEQKLLQPFSQYALEQLRTRFLYAATTTHEPVKSARVAVQMAYDTEAGVILTKLATIPPDIFASKVCQRRRFLEVDGDMRNFKFLYEPALAALSATVPDPYINLLRRYLSSDYARYRMSATAAMLCLVAATA